MKAFLLAVLWPFSESSNSIEVLVVRKMFFLVGSGPGYELKMSLALFFLITDLTLFAFCLKLSSQALPSFRETFVSSKKKETHNARSNLLPKNLFWSNSKL